MGLLQVLDSMAISASWGVFLMNLFNSLVLFSMWYCSISSPFSSIDVMLHLSLSTSIPIYCIVFTSLSGECFGFRVGGVMVFSTFLYSCSKVCVLGTG